ncbi:MAG: DUF4926 domain-containing protein [Tepidisphaeraceae bacterium]|jgi:hypothetical protein
MATKLKLHETVALLKDLPREGLRRGQVGTVVAIYKSGRCEVEFADSQGRTFALATLAPTQLLRLAYDRTSRRGRTKLVA